MKASKSSIRPGQQRSRSTTPVEDALRLFNAGRLEDAERILSKTLRKTPTNADALQLLGLIAARRGKLDQAEELLRRCTAIAPRHRAASINLGNVLITRGKLAEAAEVYRHAVKITPTSAPAHYNLARCLRALGRLEAAAAAYRKALEINPEFIEAQINFGLLLGELESYEEAEAHFRKLIAERPKVLDLRLYLGDVLRRQGRLQAACGEYRSLLAAKPAHPRARLMLGLALVEENALEEAAALIEGVTAGADVSAADLLSAQAALANRRGDKQAAITKLSAAIDAGSQDPEQYLTLATWLTELRQRERAIAVLEKSLSKFGDRPAGLLGQLVFNQRHLCDWRNWEERASLLIDRIRQSERSVISPFAAQSMPGLTPEDLLKVSQAYALRFKAWEPLERLTGQSRNEDSRIRIGYLSADFHEHATAFLTAAIFEHHDRQRFEVVAYSWGPNDHSTMRRRLEGAFDRFVEVGSESFTDTARRIQHDGIDILVDLKGYTRDARTEILALRPSPIQVNWLGFPGSMGAPFIDYAIVDPVVVPEEQSSAFTEALAYLPNAYAPVDNRRQVAAPTTRGEAGLPETGFVFCCFNNPYKITLEVFECWCRLLQTVPDSVLWLFASNDRAPLNLAEEAKRRDIDPNRLVFAPRLPQSEHLSRLALADLCLDTLPYNAHTTSSDALWMGVPVLTCPGETFASRVAASLLLAADMPELVCTDLHEYEARARHLALHDQELAVIRQKLGDAKRTAAFFDSERFTRDIEALYVRMWERHQQGLPPARLS